MADSVLSETQLVFLRDVLGLTPSSRGADRISIVDLGKARIEWSRGRSQAAAGIEKLKATISAEYANDPEMAKPAANALNELSRAIEKLDASLEDELDVILNAEADERAALVAPAVTKAQSILEFCDSDPLMQIMDGNEYTPDLAIVGPMRSQLAGIIHSLGH